MPLEMAYNRQHQTFSLLKIPLQKDKDALKHLISLLQHRHCSSQLIQHITALHDEPQSSTIALVGSSIDGYLVRSDIVSFRLQHVQSIPTIYDIAMPCSWMPAMPTEIQGRLPAVGDLDSLLESTISIAIIQGPDQSSLDSIFTRLFEELNNKLNMPMTLTEPPVTRRICVVGGGYSYSFRADLFKGAAAVGVKLVIVDKPGHWVQLLEGNECEAFLPIDMTRDEGFSGRIVASCRESGLQFDGITTYADDLRVPTARAAQELGLPTDSPEALEICTSKDKFRQNFPIEGYPSLCVSSMAEFHARADELVPHFPFIIKPRNGANSAGVAKAETLAEAENLVEATIRSGSAALVEKYIDGPEVDIDFVFIDGEVAFCDITDEPPCTAELFGPEDAPASFIESKAIYPGMLPPSEHSVLRETALAALTKLGFKHGVFHMEARVIDSSMQWSRGKDERKLPYLEKRATQKEVQPRAMLIEINPRTQGHACTAAITSCYGIDFTLLQLLLCIEDTHRARLLSVPFTDLKNTCSIVECMITPREGVFHGENMFDDLRGRLPHLMERVVDEVIFYKDGDTVKDPSKRASWLAYFTVKSEEGREDAMRIGDDIRKNLRYEIV